MATTTAGAWTKKSENGYLVGTSAETAVLPDATGNQVSPTITEELGNKKTLVGINVTTAFSDVASTLIVEGSTDGTNWCTLATASSDTTPNVTGVKLYLVDLSSIKAPYYRLNHNAGGLSLGILGKLKFIYTNA